MRPLLILLLGAAATPGAALAQAPADAPPAPVLAPLPTVQVTDPPPEAKTVLPPPAPVARADTAPIQAPAATTTPPTLVPAKEGVKIAPIAVGVAAGAAGGAVAGPVGKFVGGFVGKRLLAPLFGGKDDTPEFKIADSPQAASAQNAAQPAAAEAGADGKGKKTSKVAER
jgi:2-oxoglutarate dehydrogenase E2 component (dihydrolipoamide succinyltransferase)